MKYLLLGAITESGQRLSPPDLESWMAELGDHEQASTANERALELAANPAERELLARRLAM